MSNLEKTYIHAVSTGDLASVKKCLAKGVDINTEYRDGALYRACKNNQYDILVHLINNGISNETTLNVLSCVVRNKNNTMMKLLFEYDIGINDASNVLDIAICAHSIDILETLLKNCAIDDVNFGLILAIAENDTHCTELLLEYGADIHCEDDWSLSLATKLCHKDMIRLLLDNDAPITTNTLSICIHFVDDKKQQYNIIKMFTKHDPKFISDNKWFLRACLSYKLVRSARYILKHVFECYDIDDITDNGLTSYVIRKKITTGVNLFLNRCINFNIFFCEEIYIQMEKIWIGSLPKNDEITVKDMINSARNFVYTKIKDQYIAPLVDTIYSSTIFSSDCFAFDGSYGKGDFKHPIGSFYTNKRYYIFEFRINISSGRNMIFGLVDKETMNHLFCLYIDKGSDTIEHYVIKMVRYMFYLKWSTLQ